MMGFFAIYSGPWADKFGGAKPVRRRLRLGMLPHEIAALNDAR